ncbi:AMP deaminase [Arachis hypogaea]|nr:AMP deaminase [Arachis hypogaea]
MGLQEVNIDNQKFLEWIEMGGGAAGAPDFFYKEAQRLGYVARSAFKLVQIQKQHKLIKAGSSVLDLGCAPGAWLQVVCQSLGPPNHGGSVLGIDLKVFQSTWNGSSNCISWFELFDRGFLVVGSCVEIGIPMLILFIALSQDKGITRQIPSKTKRSTHDHRCRNSFAIASRCHTKVCLFYSVFHEISHILCSSGFTLFLLIITLAGGRGMNSISSFLSGSMPKQSAIRTRIVVMAGQEGPTITRTKRKSATQHGGSTLLDLLQALEDYLPVLLGLVNDESRRASVDIFLKAAGYLDCAVKHVLSQLPAELRRNLPVDLAEGTLRALSLQALGYWPSVICDIHVVGFDLVDDESKPERRPTKHMPTPAEWTNEFNPAYSYYLYYCYANLYTLNKLRESKGMTAIKLRPIAERYFLAEIEGPEQKSDSEADKGLLMLLDSDLLSFEVDFMELQNSKWRALN